jgi:hypothetical protein
VIFFSDRVKSYTPKEHNLTVHARISSHLVISTDCYSGYGWVAPESCSGGLSWVPCSGGSAPGDAVRAGQDQDGGPILAGRAFHEGDLLPAKVTPTHGCAFVSHAGQEHVKHDYEVSPNKYSMKNEWNGLSLD